MRVLQINIRVNKGSVSRITEQIGQVIIAQGWESYIAYGRPSNESKSKLIQIGSYTGVKIHYLLSQLTGRHGLYSIHATKEFVRHIEELKPDIIHLQNIQGYYLNYKVLFNYLNETEIPIVWTMHSCWPFTGKCPHFVAVGCDKWKTECHDCPLKSCYPRSLFFDFSREDYRLKKKLFTANKNLHLVPVSYWLESLVKQSFLKNSDIRVIHNGIDLTVFRPRPRTTSHKIKILGVASAWNKDKGLYDFFRLRERLDVSDYDITLIGLTPEQLREVPDGIIGIQRTYSLENLAEYYSDADVFVNLTYADTFPTVNLEALACGTPVITYHTGGSPETIDERTGVVVEQGDIDGVVKAIEAWRQLSLEEIKKQRTQCRLRAEDKYERKACFEQYIELYKEICAQKN